MSSHYSSIVPEDEFASESPASLGNAAAMQIKRYPPLLLSGLSEASLEKFLAGCTIRRYSAPKEVLQQDTPFGFCFLILHGLVEVSTIDMDGNRVVAHVAGPGEVVGEVEIFSGRPCAATCTTTPGTILASFTARHIMAHVQPQMLLHNFACIYHDRLARTCERQALFMHHDAEERIRFHLLKMTAADRPVAQISQTTLAALTDCSRQTANRILSQWREEGIVQITRGAIRVLRRDLLESAGSIGRDHPAA